MFELDSFLARLGAPAGLDAIKPVETVLRQGPMQFRGHAPQAGSMQAAPARTRIDLGGPWSMKRPLAIILRMPREPPSSYLEGAMRPSRENPDRASIAAASPDWLLAVFSPVVRAAYSPSHI